MAAEADKLMRSGTDSAGAEMLQNGELVDGEDDDEEKIPDWIRCSPADLYFKRDSVSVASYYLSGINHDNSVWST